MQCEVWWTGTSYTTSCWYTNGKMPATSTKTTTSYARVGTLDTATGLNSSDRRVTYKCSVAVLINMSRSKPTDLESILDRQGLDTSNENGARIVVFGLVLRSGSVDRFRVLILQAADAWELLKTTCFHCIYVILFAWG